MATDEALKHRQDVGSDVERKMLDFLVRFHPARGLKLEDVHCIAAAARIHAFDTLEAISKPRSAS